MTKKKILLYLRRILFVVILVSLLCYVFMVFERKTIDGAWNYTLKVNGFTNEPENSFQLIGFGSSHMYCTMNPLHIYETTGIRSYVLATQQQPAAATYYYVKEAFETQKPDVVILEAYMFLQSDFVAPEGTLHDAVDSFPEGKNKFDMINALDTPDGKENYHFNFMKYHTRWKELTAADFDLSYRSETDPMHGYVFVTNNRAIDMKQQDYSQVQEIPLSQTNMEYLQKTVDLIRENGSEVLLLLTPYLPKGFAGQSKTLHRFAQEEDLEILDMNLCYDDIGLDSSIHYYDTEHLNVYGAEIASEYLVNYIREHFTLTPRDANDDAAWQEDLQAYHNAKKAS